MPGRAFPRRPFPRVKNRNNQTNDDLLFFLGTELSSPPLAPSLSFFLSVVPSLSLILPLSFSSLTLPPSLSHTHLSPYSWTPRVAKTMVCFFFFSGQRPESNQPTTIFLDSARQRLTEIFYGYRSQ